MVDSLAWSGTVPWHGLGVELPSNTTGEDMIRRAGLDWEVIPTPLFAGLCSDTGYGVSVPGYKMLTRADRPGTVLSVVSESYGIIQNRDALEVMESAVGEGAAVYHVAGSLDEGRQIFLLAELAMPEGRSWTLAGEKYRPFLLVTSGHDGTRSLQVMFTAIRVVCNNTLTAAMAGRQPRITIRHTRNAADRVKQAAEVIASARDYFKGFSQTALELVKKSLDSSTAEAITERLFPAVKVDGKLTVTKGIEKARGRVLALYSGQGDTSDRAIAGTAWGYYNALTAYTDHNKSRRGGAEGRMRALTMSSLTDDMKADAIKYLVAA
jgi:phage/plasmid-like protein (TIGR03299 family)